MRLREFMLGDGADVDDPGIEREVIAESAARGQVAKYAQGTSTRVIPLDPEDVIIRGKIPDAGEPASGTTSPTSGAPVAALAVGAALLGWAALKDRTPRRRRRRGRR